LRQETSASAYLEKNFGLHHPLLERIKSDLKQEGLDFMSVSSAEARLLQFFVKSFAVKSIVEIGSLYGYSALAMALALPPDGRIHCFEKDEQRAEKIDAVFKEAGLSCSAQVHAGDALSALKDIEKEAPFDLVFIDANKSAYMDYLDWAEKNTGPGALIIGDNTFLFGAVWGDSKNAHVGQKQIEIMTRFNHRLADQSVYDSILIPTPEGMTVGRKKERL
jgi:predicted O-methyltransferase YrrM